MSNSTKEVEESALRTARTESLLGDCRLAHTRALQIQQEMDYDRQVFNHQAFSRRAENAEDEKNGYHLFIGPVDEESVSNMLYNLRLSSRLFPGQPWTIELVTPGGEIIHGLRLYDELLRFRTAGHHLTIRVRGEAASMGCVILQAADVREAGPSSFIMAHRAAGGAEGTADQMEDQLQLMKKLEGRIYEILAQRSGQTTAFWKKRLGQRKDQWYSAEEALKVGLIDAIG